MPKFIVLTGGDGVGKTTQVGLLAAALPGGCLVTAEPGATPAGARIRELLLDGEVDVSPWAMELLFAADRAQNVAENIRPALDAGYHVVSSRFGESSLVYASARGSGRTAVQSEDIARLSLFATGGLTPDLTVLLDAVDVPVGGLDGSDRIERLGEDYQQAVRAKFREFAAARPASWEVVRVHADDTRQRVHTRVRRAVRARLGI